MKENGEEDASLRLENNFTAPYGKRLEILGVPAITSLNRTGGPI